MALMHDQACSRENVSPCSARPAVPPSVLSRSQAKLEGRTGSSFAVSEGLAIKTGDNRQSDVLFPEHCLGLYKGRIFLDIAGEHHCRPQRAFVIVRMCVSKIFEAHGHHTTLALTSRNPGSTLPAALIVTP
jgi:hypothetical protein